MNHELSALHSIVPARKRLVQLHNQCKKYALNTFSQQHSQGVYGQALELAQLVLRRNTLRWYLNQVYQALLKVPRGYRALLAAAYVRKIPYDNLCLRFGVSLSTLYRKLAKARKLFQKALRSLPSDFPTAFCCLANGIEQ